MAHTAAPDNRFGSQMTWQPPANHVLLGAGLQGEFSAYKKTVYRRFMREGANV